MTNPIEWRDIPGYEGWYQASRCGKVRAIQWYHPRWKCIIPKIKELAPLWYRKGYYNIQFSTCAKTRERSRQYIHRVIYRTFHGEIPEGLTVNHIDGTHDNNHADNLELATHLEQSLHARAQGKLIGRRKKPCTLTSDDVLEIRRILDATEPPTNKRRDALASRYGVSNGHIRFIELRQVWTHV